MKTNDDHPMSEPSHIRLHHYPDYAWLRGFSMVPSWGARIEQAWWNYHPDRFREEAALATQLHSNTIRLWIEFTAWMADPDGVQASFMDAIDAIDELGMKIMPCIFNRWHDRRWDYGGTYNEDLGRNIQPNLDYVRTIVTPLAADPRILIWDLCCEPSGGRKDDPAAVQEFNWLSRVADTVRESGAQQPITIGTHESRGEMHIDFGSLCDVLCCHPYGRTREELTEMLAKCAAYQQRHGKPMLCNEAVAGCLDDARRADCARWSTRMLEDAGYGWMGWALREGKAAATRRDRISTNGIDDQGFAPWFNADGTLRAGLEFFTEKPRFLAPWIKEPNKPDAGDSTSRA